MRKGFTLIELMIVIAIIAIIAAIAIPNLLESRVTANEAAASASLKSAVFAGEVQFAGGSYQDRDLDNVGEYGTVGMLCGRDATTKMPTAATNGLTLVQGALASAASGTTAGRTTSDYLFWGFAPSQTNTTQVTTDGITEGASLVSAITAGNSCDNGEKFFCVGAAPSKYASSGRRVFMITHDGQVRSPATSADIAVWFGSATPSTGTASTAALIQAGLADGFAAAAWAVTVMDAAQPSYPIYTK